MASGDLTQHFGAELVARLAEMLAEAAGAPGESGLFERHQFEAVSADLEELSLMQRVLKMGEALADALSANPHEAWAVMAAGLPEPLPESGKPFSDGYWMLPLAAYWAVRYERAAGEQSARDELWPVAVRAFTELTQRGTAEFAVRPFAAVRPEKMLEVVRAWCEHPNFHVRRLASEGTRPYLPWGGKLRVTREDRLLLLEAVTPLCRDPSAYVRRSVGNHVRDWHRIDHEVADRWIERVDAPADVVKLALPRRRRGAAGAEQ